ncbi:hypothetical protein HK096_008664 [Nowakowskiella sp. JEL0078]|nr:hypothetical protein HK096_008664 [Nowakowskiella sp. JEL0078]
MNAISNVNIVTKISALPKVVSNDTIGSPIICKSLQNDQAGLISTEIVENKHSYLDVVPVVPVVTISLNCRPESQDTNLLDSLPSPSSFDLRDETLLESSDTYYSVPNSLGSRKSSISAASSAAALSSKARHLKAALKINDQIELYETHSEQNVEIDYFSCGHSDCISESGEFYSDEENFNDYPKFESRRQSDDFSIDQAEDGHDVHKKLYKAEIKVESLQARTADLEFENRQLFEEQVLHKRIISSLKSNEKKIIQTEISLKGSLEILTTEIEHQKLRITKYHSEKENLLAKLDSSQEYSISLEKELAETETAINRIQLQQKSELETSETLFRKYRDESAQYILECEKQIEYLLNQIDQLQKFKYYEASYEKDKTSRNPRQITQNRGRRSRSLSLIERRIPRLLDQDFDQSFFYTQSGDSAESTMSFCKELAECDPNLTSKRNKQGSILSQIVEPLPTDLNDNPLSTNIHEPQFSKDICAPHLPIPHSSTLPASTTKQTPLFSKQPSKKFITTDLNSLENTANPLALYSKSPYNILYKPHAGYNKLADGITHTHGSGKWRSPHSTGDLFDQTSTLIDDNCRKDHYTPHYFEFSHSTANLNLTDGYRPHILNGIAKNFFTAEQLFDSRKTEIGNIEVLDRLQDQLQNQRTSNACTI